MPQARVGIIGLGQGGKALAVHLASRGHKPLIYCCPGHRIEYEYVKNNGSVLKASHATEGTFKVQLVDDLAEFVVNTDYIIIVTLSTAHREILCALQKHDLRKTTIVALPGGGSFAAKARQVGLRARNILESCTLPYASRSPGPGEVAVLYVKETFPLASVKVMQEHDRLVLSHIFDDRVEWRNSILNIWLNCTNPVVHCPPMVFNAGRVESGNPFHLYGEGITPSVARATMALDAERMAIAASNGEKTPSVLEWTNIWYNSDYPDWVSFAQGSAPHNKHGLAPTRLKGQRFLDEDMKETMVLWYCLGRLRGLELPVMRSMITLTSSMVDEDYLTTGTTLQSLGLGGMTADDILDMFGAPKPQDVITYETRPVKTLYPSSPSRSSFPPDLRHLTGEPGLLSLIGKQTYIF
ncbi:6-phosphogluconate dehydrogenase C-terminal domain-like protein [Cryphonectria parasitica EP155]|uniref:6-phosphogluconate dehydrogenase C-terminal domain-like protein n=1 Tax=Cryphonectria parasitica (strain ATCC 38755 / EP155) TaxID=660469 RepID=A0A9P4Y1K9_CRYP1|nr:6-phosphogluconate dehydrogenase C-terminal domain-like protein [Cryphonectria parasitica EP155]KAF3764667.1 6-phosphogluconate dehydrogenase C-terminal domain-like protein [Cryphonectria parasitica EP155]